MPDAIASLVASPQLATGALLYGALALYAAAVAFALFATGVGRAVLWIGIALHLGALIGRGWIIEFFPLTNKLESFSAASLAHAHVTAASWREVRLYVVPLLVLACISLGTALQFPLAPSYPPPQAPVQFGSPSANACSTPLM